MRSRHAIQAELQEAREAMIKLGTHMQVRNGVRPENRAKTDPANWDVKVVRRWARRYGLDYALEDVEELRELCVERQQDADFGGPSLDALQSAYEGLASTRDTLRAEMAELGEEAKGPPQTVNPEGLSVEALTSIPGLAE